MKKTLSIYGLLIVGICFVQKAQAQTENEPESILEDPYMWLQWSHINDGNVPVYNSSTLYCGLPGFDLNIEEAWEYMANLKYPPAIIRVGVLDSGLDDGHPDLNQTRLIQGKNYTASPFNFNTADDYGHGTHVTGAIMATSYNGIGIAGVDRTCKVMPIKIQPACLRSQRWHIDSAIRYAIANNVRVINMSWGWSEATIDNNIRDAISLGIDNGCVFIGAAGNFNNYYYTEKVHFPGKVGIAVGAANPCGAIKTGNTPLTCEKDNRPIDTGNGTINWGSNSGDGLDIMGPGTMIPAIDIRGLQEGLSGVTGCFGNCYASDDGNGNYVTNAFGTSIATPYVTGIVSQMLAVNPQLKMHEIEYLLKASSTTMTGGYKWPNAYQAVQMAKSFIPESRPLVDLFISSIQYQRVGANVQATIKIKNRTGIASGQFKLYVYNSQTWIDNNYEYDVIGSGDSILITNISGNAEPTFIVTIPYDAPGTHNLYLNAVIDPSMALEEMNKANNARSLLVYQATGGEIEDPEEMSFKSGEAEIAETSSLELFPNPASEQVMLTIELTCNGEIQLTDLLGNRLHQQELQSGKQNLLIDTSKLASGVYLVELKQANGKSMLKKLIIQ